MNPISIKPGETKAYVVTPDEMKKGQVELAFKLTLPATVAER